MPIIVCCVLAFVSVVALVVMFYRRPLGLKARGQATTNGSVQKTKDFSTLRALTNELDSTIFSLRLAVTKAAGLITDWPDSATLSLVETRLGMSLRGGQSVSASMLNAAAGQLERNLASCQTVCAMIEPGPIESSDRSRVNDSFVSLLSRVQKQLSIIPGRMKEERRIVSDVCNDLAAAQRMMETATLVVRCIPLKARFADLRVLR